MFSNQNIVCAVEFGSSKICLLIGQLETNGKVRLLGYEAVSSANAVVKGEISDMINNGKNQIAQFAGKRVNTANEWITSFISQIDDNKI